MAPRSEGRPQWAEGPWRSKDFLGFPWFSFVFRWFSLVFEPLASLLSVLMARFVLYQGCDPPEAYLCGCSGVLEIVNKPPSKRD